MEILIKGMEMPVQCASCKLFSFIQFKGEIKEVCNAIDRLLENLYQRPDWCPLSEVPMPHGRLIDENMLLCFLGENIIYDSYGRTIAKVPTVIPASETEKALDGK